MKNEFKGKAFKVFKSNGTYNQMPLDGILEQRKNFGGKLVKSKWSLDFNE